MATFTDLFIRRPVLATVVSILILLIGLQSVGKLPIRQFPAGAFLISNLPLSSVTELTGRSILPPTSQSEI